MATFEFDENKSQANLLKHGIDFIEAQRLWDDLHAVQIASNAEGEPRHLVVGLLNSKHYSAVVTYRGTSIRIISVRRSRNEEVAFYEN